MKVKRKYILDVVLAVTLAFLVVGSVLAYLDRTTIEGYTIDLVSVSESLDGEQSTWVYAVTAGDEVPVIPLQKFGMSLGNCYDIVYPVDDSIYTTPDDATGAIYGCGDAYTCTEGIYTVQHIPDVMPEMNGIRFEVQSGALNSENQSTHIFTMTLQNTDARRGDSHTGVFIDETLTATLSGPVCAPNPVTIRSVTAYGRSGYQVFAVLAGMIVLALIWRRRSDRSS